MQGSNYQRMFDLIDEVFATRNDPDQLQVNEEVIQKLQALHPSTLSEYADENGPLIWALIFPTTNEVMNDFLDGKITENELLQKTKPDQKYDAIYLCSAITLPEMRGKGETKKICLNAIKEICDDHKIKSLFVWAFTKEGEVLAEGLAKSAGLELKKKKDINNR